MATRNPRAVLGFFVLLLIAIGGAVGLGIWRQQAPGPIANFVAEPRHLGAATPLELQLTAEGGVRSVRVELLQDEATHILLEQEFEPPYEQSQSLPVDVNAAELELAEDEALVLVYVRDGLWRSTDWRRLRIEDGWLLEDRKGAR